MMTSSPGTCGRQIMSFFAAGGTPDEPRNMVGRGGLPVGHDLVNKSIYEEVRKYVSNGRVCLVNTNKV